MASCGIYYNENIKALTDKAFHQMLIRLRLNTAAILRRSLYNSPHLVQSQKIENLFYFSRKKLTSSAWESSDDWHPGEPIPRHISNSPPCPCCLPFKIGKRQNMCVCVFKPGPAVTQSSSERHRGWITQAPLDATLVRIRPSTPTVVLWMDVCHCLVLGSLMSLTFNQTQCGQVDICPLPWQIICSQSESWNNEVFVVQFQLASNILFYIIWLIRGCKGGVVIKMMW